LLHRPFAGCETKIIEKSETGEGRRERRVRNDMRGGGWIGKTGKFCGKNALMTWIYLSPHFDDVALSCGGLAWEQAAAGRAVEIWTVCAGEPGSEPLSEFARWLQARWGTGQEAVAQRRDEDLRSCQILSARPRHFSLPDCIYRTDPVTGIALYGSEESIFGTIHPAEAGLVQSVQGELAQQLPAEANLVCPLGLGGHVDHRLVRAAAEALEHPLWYYADYPYVLDQGEAAERATSGMELATFTVSPAALEAWERAVAAHASQVSTFWSNEEGMRAGLGEYYRRSGGFCLWRAPGS
jgi:LmbE family N-acetylglucosaminyl deacetylase